MGQARRRKLAGTYPIPMPPPKDPQPRARMMLDYVKDLRRGLAIAKENPHLPHRVEDPRTGEVIDLLDGETDRLLDQMEQLALLSLRLKGSRA